MSVGGDLFFWSVVGFGGGIFLFFKGLIWLKQKRLIENLPTSKIRSLAMGLVEIFGEVFPAEKKILIFPMFKVRYLIWRSFSVEFLNKAVVKWSVL